MLDSHYGNIYPKKKQILFDKRINLNLKFN